MNVIMASSNENWLNELRYESKQCFCKKKAIIRVSETRNHPKKLFYTCARNAVVTSSDSACNFFQWCLPMAPHNVCALKYETRSCKCNKKAIIRVSETSTHPNKLFYTCARKVMVSSSSAACDFFEWCIPLPNLSPTGSTDQISAASGTTCSQSISKDNFTRASMEGLKTLVVVAIIVPIILFAFQLMSFSGMKLT